MKDFIIGWVIAGLCGMVWLGGYVKGRDDGVQWTLEQIEGCAR